MTFSHKTKAERLGEVIKILKQIFDFGLPADNEGIKEFKRILSKWVDDGNYVTGKVKLEGYEREIVYGLYIRRGVEIVVNLKFVKGL